MSTTMTTKGGWMTNENNEVLTVRKPPARVTDLYRRWSRRDYSDLAIIVLVAGGMSWPEIQAETGCSRATFERLQKIWRCSAIESMLEAGLHPAQVRTMLGCSPNVITKVRKRLAAARQTAGEAA